MAGILVAGAINTDLIAFVERAPQAGETVAGGYFEQHGGGKGANQAVAAARSGADVTLFSAVGADAYGEARRAALTAEGIDVSEVAIVDSSASGVAIIIVEATGENRICDLPGAREYLDADSSRQALERAKPSVLLATNELPFECLHTLFAAASDRSVPVWFNVAPYSDTARDLLPYVDTLIANRGEAEDLVSARGAHRDINRLATDLLELGVNNVIITMGADGVQGFRGSRAIQIAAEPVTPVDTTGAGDTFCGAWAAEMMRGSSFDDALRYGNRAAAISVTRRGAQSSIPTRSEVLSE